MARVIFIATVLVALCYTSQAFPTIPEIKLPQLPDNIKDKINDLREKIDDLTDLTEILKKIKPETVTLASRRENILENIWGIQKIPLEILGKAADITDKVVQLGTDVAKDAVGIATDILRKISGTEKNKNDTPTEEVALAGISDLINKGKEGIRGGVDKITEGVRDTSDKIKDTGRQITDDIMDETKKIIEKIDETKDKILG